MEKNEDLIINQNNERLESTRKEVLQSSPIRSLNGNKGSLFTY
jgi:hypothetical protein